MVPDVNGTLKVKKEAAGELVTVLTPIDLELHPPAEGCLEQIAQCGYSAIGR
jgi:hypothetical protein